MGAKKGLSIVLLVALFLLIPARADAATVSDISRELICQCGCNMVLPNCAHSECMARDTMATLIEERLAQGQSKEQIIRFFVAQYGEQVLATPTKRGFNLVAWVLPFAALLFGGGVVYTALKMWVRRGRRFQVGAMADVGEGDERCHLCRCGGMR